MCFSIPYQVIAISKNTAILEGGKRVTFGTDTTIHKHDYVRVLGDIVVSVLDSEEGLKVRQLIKQLNTPYEASV